MSWSLKGRAAIASVEPSTRYHITRSHVMTQCANKPLLWVIEELTTIPTVGVLSGPTRKVEYFICLVARLLQICPAVEIVNEMLRQETHKYVRVAAMIVIRLIGSTEMINKAVEIGLADYRKIRMFSDAEELPAALRTGVKGPSIIAGTRRGHKEAGVSEAENDAADEQLNAMMELKAPHYFISHVDELTEKLFDLRRRGAEEGEQESVFYGLPLPPLIDRPKIPLL